MAGRPRNTCYNGNEKLKKAGVKMDFTLEQVQEIMKCTSDPFYFIENYVKIVTLDDGLVACKLYDYQRKMIQNIIDNRFLINLCPRRSGKTIAYVSFIIWYILFNDQKNIILLANKIKTAKGILAKVKLAYLNLPLWLQQGIAEWNKTSIELENGSKITVDATSESAARSEGANIVILDEFAFVPDNVASDFYRSVYPVITSGTDTKIVIVSTPNGVNLFYKLWIEALQKINDYVPFSVHWSDVPGRDEKWKLETVKQIGQDAFNTEFGCEFFGSTSNTLINSAKLRRLAYEKPIYSDGKGLDLFETPTEDKDYVICIDTARGVKNNYSAFTIIKVTDIPYTVVAKYRSNEISTMDYPKIIVDIANKYNKAYILVEINDIGGQVVDSIKYEYNYEHVFSTLCDRRTGLPKITVGEPHGYKIGVRTTRGVKKIGCANLKSLVEENKILIRDFDIISELSKFVSVGNSFAAEKGTDDDLVMTLVLFSWLTGQKYFKELTNQNLKHSIADQVVEEITNNPIIFTNSGLNLVPIGGLPDREDVVDGDLWLSGDSIEQTDEEDRLIELYNDIVSQYSKLSHN